MVKHSFPRSRPREVPPHVSRSDLLELILHFGNGRIGACLIEVAARCAAAADGADSLFTKLNRNAAGQNEKSVDGDELTAVWFFCMFSTMSLTLSGRLEHR